jgi:hypothetical protein
MEVFLVSGVLGGTLVGLLVLRATPTGEGWAGWQRATLAGDPYVGRFVTAVLVGAAGAAGVGLGLPDWARGLLLGPLFGFCIPFAVMGIRRYRRRPPDEIAAHRAPYRLPSAWGTLGGAAGCALVGVLLGLRGHDLIALAVLGGVLVPLRSLIEQFFSHRRL